MNFCILNEIENLIKKLLNYESSWVLSGTFDEVLNYYESQKCSNQADQTL